MDFVIMWVDGSDDKWLSEKEKYEKDSVGDKRNARFRDWDNLHYWFRGVEKYAPSVEKIHFVTEGHTPKWLNLNSPKINIVKHSDIIDDKYLPLFNSRAIEINLHKIKGLSQQFVYFNDDMFITDYVEREYFFKDGLPCDIKAYNVISPINDLAIPLIRNMKIINKYFNKTSILNNKLLNYKYGIKNNFRTTILNLWPNLIGFFEPHQPSSFLKETFETVWDKEKDILERTLESRFKNDTNINQYLFRYWQLASNKFMPRDVNSMQMLQIIDKNDVLEASKSIISKKYKLLCINDSSDIYDFDDAVNIVKSAFEKVLPNKSKYEL